VILPRRHRAQLWGLALSLVAARLGAQSLEPLAPTAQDVGSTLTLRDDASVQLGEGGLQLAKGGYAEWAPRTAPSLNAGTFILWVKPQWPSGDNGSHAFASFRWSGVEPSYFVLSQGWWEPDAAGKLTAVVSNQQSLSCFMPWEFHYTIFLPRQWTMLAVTWQAGTPGHLGLYVDGRLMCERRQNFEGDRRSVGPVYLGSDRGAPVAPGTRPAEATLKDLVLTSRALSATEIRRLYLRRAGDEDPKWIQALAPADPPGDKGRERRIMQDEDTRWAASKGEIRKRIERVRAAGFNVYMPNVWDGAHAFYAARHAPLGPAVRDPVDPGYDPLAYLIELAHRDGIAVHPWFIVVRHASGSTFPVSYLDGAPPDAFNVHTAEFRDFIVSLINDVAERYEVDGINLDYIQSLGPCTNAPCVDEYAARYHRSLTEDWRAQERGDKVPSLMAWNAAAVTDVVSRVAAGVRRAKPQAVISIDANPLDHASRHQGLDEERWLKEGLIDALIDMTYDDPIDVDGVDRAVKAYSPARMVINVRNYDLFDDSWANRSARVMADYIHLIRTRWPGAGIGFYQYAHMDAAQMQLKQGAFAQAAAPHWNRALP
jgi:uncharacterized lipoprotein YddW (UPF0748 family)